MKKLFIAIVAVAMMGVLIPLAALADDEQHVECSLNLGVLDPGTLDLTAWPHITTNGEMLSGSLDCNVDELDGVITTTHASMITIENPASFPDLGDFNGKLRGVFTIDRGPGKPGLTGNMKARISGTLLAKLDGPFGAFEVHQVIDNGRWSLDSHGVEGRGFFEISLIGIVGVPFDPSALFSGLAGSGSLSGEVSVDDDDSDDDDRSDAGGDDDSGDEDSDDRN